MSGTRYLFTDRQFSDLNPLHAGEEKNVAGRHVGPTMRHKTVLHYVLQGKGVYCTQGGVYPVEAGQAFLLLPNEIVSYTADPVHPWHYQWIVFDGKLSESFRQLPPVFPLSAKHFRNIFSHIGDTTTREYKIASQLFLLYAELFSNEPQNNDYITRVQSYIHTAYMEPLTVEQIAREMNLDRRYLSWLFKKKTTQTIQQYLINVRLEEAQAHLRQGRSVQEAALLCGYEDVSNFSKMFKRLYGQSPAHWRAQESSETSK